MIDEKTIWDQKYGGNSHSNLAPDPLLEVALKEYIDPLFQKPGTALDVAGGLGRHSIPLAKRGWKTTLVDVSEIAIANARQNAKEAGTTINAVCEDLRAATLKFDRFNLILVFFYMQRDIFPALIDALLPGGLIVYKTYTERQLELGKAPSHPLHLLQENELVQHFRSLTLLHYRETLVEKGVAELIARKP